MPLVAEHLVIAKKYLENHPQKNKSEFINGGIAADFWRK